MKKLFAMMVFVGLAVSPAMAEEKTYPGPQEAAGNVYHQVFDNEKVRISEITFKPGDKAAMHTHSWPHAVYVIEPGTLTLTHPDGTSATVSAKAGEVLWMGPESHEAVNTGETTLRATVTEIKG